MLTSFGFDPRFRAIAVTGGPCAGKSTFLPVARQWLEDRGCRVAVLNEVATELIMAGLAPFATWGSHLDFQRHNLLYSLEREQRYYEALCDLETDRPLVLLCDRGVLDALAYVERGEYLEMIKELGIDLHVLRERYAAVIHLVTAANGAEKYYTLENNAARTESPEGARNLDILTQNAWLGHSHMRIIDNSTDFQGKIHRGLNALARVIQMPEPYEIERKFVIKNFTLDMIPPDAAEVQIEQRYLMSKDGTERRIRSRELDDASSFYYTEKKSTGESGKRLEWEKQITAEEYVKLLREQDPETGPILKTRFCFIHAGKHFEVDSYRHPIFDLAILEVELEDISETVEIPSGWEVEEVTDDPRYKNASIARGSLESR